MTTTTDAHEFQITATWTGNKGQGTRTYGAYSRNHELTGPTKGSVIKCSSDPMFRGDGSRYNPEEMFVASLSTCHMLWYLHLAADAGIVVTDYVDNAVGTMVEHESGAGEFTRVLLRPQVVITDASRIGDAMALHDKAREVCFVARSVKCAVEHEPRVTSK